MEFSATYDRTTKIVTIAAAALLFGVAIASHSGVALAIGALIVALAYAWSPQAYVVAAGVLTIKRVIGRVSIPLNQVLEMRAASDDDFNGSIRLFGSGGLFGYYGLFRTAKLGTSTWYVTNRKHCVVLITDRKAFVVSPDDVEGFLRAASLSLPPVHHEWTPQPSR